MNKQFTIAINMKMGTRIVCHYSLANCAVVFITVVAMRTLLRLHRRMSSDNAASPQQQYAIVYIN